MQCYSIHGRLQRLLASQPSLSPGPLRWHSGAASTQPGTDCGGKAPPGPCCEGSRSPCNRHRHVSCGAAAQQQQSPRHNPEPSEPSSHTAQSAIHQSSAARRVAHQQLLRIEQQGAFAGLVNGDPGRSPSSTAVTDGKQQGASSDGSAASSSRAVVYDDGNDDVEVGRLSTSNGKGSQPSAKLSPRDQRLVKDLVSGTVRWKRRLDYIISTLLSKSPDTLEPAMLQLLRLAVYELAFRDLPAHAINQYVQLCKSVVRPAAAGLANALLRKAAEARNAGTLPNPDALLADSSRGRDLVRNLAISYSHPNWMVKRWLQQLGREQAVALLKSNNKRPVHCIRANPLKDESVPSLLGKLQELGVQATASALLPQDFIRVERGLQRVLAAGLVSEGHCAVQDEAAGLVVRLLDPQPGEQVLDCCAAPGGKTIFAATCMQGQGSITALDISAAKLSALASFAKAFGVDEMVRTHVEDLRQFSTQQQQVGVTYDRVLLDAPCSGTGVLAKRADMRWRRSEEQLQELQTLQDELLEAAAPLVRPGGTLVYSTCSIEPEECAGRVEYFLQRHPEFEIVSASGVLTAAVPESLALTGQPGSLISDRGFLVVLPHVHDSDGAFAARLRHRS